jgi:hypothetical protein
MLACSATAELFRIDGAVLTITGADPSLVFDVGTSGDTDFWFGVREDASADDNDTLQIGDGTTPGTNPFLTIDTAGNVGIGTIAPTEELHVQDAAGAARILVEATTAGDSANLILDGDSAGAGNVVGQVQGRWNGGNIGLIRFFTGDDTGNKDEGDIAMGTYEGGVFAEHFRITQEGTIGSGTNAPKTDMTLGNDGILSGAEQDTPPAGDLVPVHGLQRPPLASRRSGRRAHRPLRRPRRDQLSQPDRHRDGDGERSGSMDQARCLRQH